MIILITDYIAVQTRKNYELTLKADKVLMKFPVEQQYAAGQKNEYAVHILPYLCMTGMNILLSVCAVILPYRQIMTSNITEAISRTE